MASFVINEWIWADASGVNGQQAQREAFATITKLTKSNHQIVVIEGSPSDQKVWQLCKSTDSVVVGIVRAYLTGLRFNLDRCVVLKQEAVTACPEDLLPLVKLDDRYLIEAQLTVPGSIIVTTDNPLRDTVIGTAGLPCLLRAEFLHSF